MRASQAAQAVQPEITGFTIALNNFEGPFDLLLQLIQGKKLDITEVALAEVTDEFISYTRSLDNAIDALEETTEFLVVAATLLDLKAARLIPRGEVDDPEDLALLESRDLLFARLLQYKAYKQVADLFAQWQKQAQRRYPRAVGLEEQFASLLPKVTLNTSPDEFAQLAAGVFQRQPPQEVETSHIHGVAVSVPEQAGKILALFRIVGPSMWLTFDQITADCGASMEVVGRFLALLELYKAHAVDTQQHEALEALEVAWTGKEVDPAVVASANWE